MLQIDKGNDSSRAFRKQFIYIKINDNSIYKTQGICRFTRIPTLGNVVCISNCRRHSFCLIIDTLKTGKEWVRINVVIGKVKRFCGIEINYHELVNR